MLAFVMIASSVLAGVGGLTNEAYAKEIGKKNEQACDHCEKVSKGETPKDSSDKPYEKLANGAVYRGGNARSVVSENKTDYELDNDPNDFANPLPYGNVYVDTSRLS